MAKRKPAPKRGKVRHGWVVLQGNDDFAVTPSNNIILYWFRSQAIMGLTGKQRTVKARVTVSPRDIYTEVPNDRPEGSDSPDLPEP